MNDPIVGIDLGTTNSAVAIVEEGRPKILGNDNQRLLPSVVAYVKEQGWLVGQPALNQYTLNPENTIRSVKRKMGSEEKTKLGAHQLLPQEISAFILRELKGIAEADLGRPVSKAVITVPAYFTNAQRQATKEAGEIAGLEVVRIINEPTAAALAYGLDTETESQLALVYDLGGGTFDVSLVEIVDGVVEVLASHGNTFLGGDDFDRVLTDYLGKQFYKTHQQSPRHNRVAMARLERAAEAAKIKLSSQVDAPVRESYLLEIDDVPYHLETSIERTDFQKMTEHLLNRTLDSLDKVFEDADATLDEVDRVLLVGGATRMPAVWEKVVEYTALEPDTEINPDEVVALGAAVQGAIIAGEPIDSILVDVTPYSLGIETANFVGNEIVDDIYAVLIHRNTTIPSTKEEVFRTVLPGQTSVHIKVYQGESPTASENILLGDFMVEDLEPLSPYEPAAVTIRFDFDVNGMLHVQATDRETGRHKKISVQATQIRLSPGQIAAARRRLDELDDALLSPDDILNAKPTINAETQVLVNRAEALLANDTLTDLQRTLLKNVLIDLQEAQTQTTIDEVAEELLDMLFDLE